MLATLPGRVWVPSAIRPCRQNEVAACAGAARASADVTVTADTDAARMMPPVSMVRARHCGTAGGGRKVRLVIAAWTGQEAYCMIIGMGKDPFEYYIARAKAAAAAKPTEEKNVEKNRWDNFTTKELLVLSVLSRGLRAEIDRRYLEHAEKVKAGTYRTSTGRVLTDADVEALADEAEHGYDVSHLMRGEDWLADARRRVEGSKRASFYTPSSYASKDEVGELRRAVRSLVAYLQDKS